MKPWNDWPDSWVWDIIGDPVNRTKVVGVTMRRVCEFRGEYPVGISLLNEFWDWAEDNRDSLGDFYYVPLYGDRYKSLFAHIDLDQTPNTGNIIFLFSNEQSAMFFKLGML